MKFERITLAGAARALVQITAVSVLALTHAQAGQPGIVSQVVVYYDRQKITRPAGAELLLENLTRAAAQVCGGQPSLYELGLYGDFTRCKKDSLARAIATVGEPMVAKLYEGRMPVAVDGQ